MGRDANGLADARANLSFAESSEILAKGVRLGCRQDDDEDQRSFSKPDRGLATKERSEFECSMQRETSFRILAKCSGTLARRTIKKHPMEICSRSDRYGAVQCGGRSEWLSRSLARAADALHLKSAG